MKSNASKLNRLFQMQPKNVVYTSRWMREMGYSLDLQKVYRKNNWLQSIGAGAMIRTGEKVNYLGAVHALQKQLDLMVHPGGKTALEFHGLLHYLSFSNNEIKLFGAPGVRLPAWFDSMNWSVKIDYHTSNFLPAGMSLKSKQNSGFEVLISSPARAFMEYLLLLKEPHEFLSAYEILMGMNNLHPKEVQELLAVCTSVKVKRLFLYMAEKTGHQWFAYLNLDNMDLGRGKRSLVKEGVYEPKYKITIPKDLMMYD